MEIKVIQSTKKPHGSYYLQEITDQGRGKKHYLSGKQLLIVRNTLDERPLENQSLVNLEWSSTREWLITENWSSHGLYIDGHKCETSIPHPLKMKEQLTFGPPNSAACRVELRITKKRKGVPLEETSTSGSLNSVDRDDQGLSRRKSSRKNPLNGPTSRSNVSIPSDVQSSSRTHVPPVNEQNVEEGVMAMTLPATRSNEQRPHFHAFVVTRSQSRNSCCDDRFKAAVPKENTSHLDQPGTSLHSEEGRNGLQETVTREEQPVISSSNEEHEVGELKKEVETLEQRLKQQEEELLRSRQLMLEAEEKLQEEQRKGLEVTAIEIVANCIESEATCVICSEFFVDATTINCGHTFCNDCITKWRRTRIAACCPVCRAIITSDSKAFVVDSFTQAVVDRLSKEDQEKRQEMVRGRLTARSDATANYHDLTSRMRARSSSSHRHSHAQHPQIYGGWSSTSNASVGHVHEYDDDFLDPNEIFSANIRRALMYQAAAAAEEEEEEEDADDERSESEMPRRRHRHGRYGRCFTCGEAGHWARNCPRS